MSGGLGTRKSAQTTEAGCPRCLARHLGHPALVVMLTFYPRHLGHPALVVWAPFLVPELAAEETGVDQEVGATVLYAIVSCAIVSCAAGRQNRWGTVTKHRLPETLNIPQDEFQIAQLPFFGSNEAAKQSSHRGPLAKLSFTDGVLQEALPFKEPLNKYRW